MLVSQCFHGYSLAALENVLQFTQVKSDDSGVEGHG